MKILVLWRVRPGADMAAVEALLVEEERFAWRMHLAGELREHYASDMPIPAISILEMESIEAAKAKLADLPIYAAGHLEPLYLELKPFTHWEVLFRDEEKAAMA